MYGTASQLSLPLTHHLDLPYIYSTEGKIKEPNLAAEAGQGLLSAVGAYARGDLVSAHIPQLDAF